MENAMSRGRRGALFRGRRWVLGGSAALFAAVFLLRLASPDPELGLGFVFVAPTSLLAIAFGIRGALAGTAASLALTWLWVIVDDVGFGPAPYLVRGGVIAFVGVTVAVYRSVSGRLERESHAWFEQSSDLHCVANTDGRFLRLNEAFVQTLGYAEEDLLARPFIDFVHPDDREETVGEIAKLAEGRDSLDFENRYLAADGGYRWLQWSATPARGGLVYASARDVTKQKELQTRLEELATTDPLTGLSNRRSFEEEAERTLTHIARYGRSAAVFMLDLDGFKAVNDVIGHHAGDEVLFCVAERLRSRLRSSDLLARLGGDEFVMFLPEVDPSEAGAIADQLLGQVSACSRTWEGSDLPITGSIGVALFESSSLERLADLVRRADTAMFTAKRAGGGRSCIDADARSRTPSESPSAGVSGP
jgi:diguanylate cyclase (GGDEF)-like protein/PAS domain S-box-containing protein